MTSKGFKTAARNNLTAFTLIELLVVIAIIAILAALMLPALTKSKGQAEKAQCMSNLKQLAVATQSYVDDHNDQLPGSIWQGVYYIYTDDQPERLLFYLARYLGAPPPSQNINTALVATCPASLRAMRPNMGSASDAYLSAPVSFLVSQEITNTIGDTNSILTRPFGYPYSSRYYRLPNGDDEPPKKMHEIKNPAQSWGMTDGDQQNAFPGGLYFNSLPANKVHGQYRNEMFFDWHIESVK